MEKVYGKSPTFFDGPTPYCAGCYHGLIQKCCIEVVDELDIRQRFVYGGAVGCNGMGSFIINADAWGTCHGRAPCVATAFKSSTRRAACWCTRGTAMPAPLAWEIRFTPPTGERPLPS